MSALLDVRDVSKRYGGVIALKAASLSVAEGEMHGLIGPNGSGKSTLLSIIAGLKRADAGSVRFSGEELAAGNVRRVRSAGIHLVVQELTIVPGLPVWENVMLGALPRRGPFVDAGAGRRVATLAFERLGVEVDVDQPTQTLAPVQQRLVMIAAGVARRGVRLLILDEPTAGLPANESGHVMTALAGLVDERRSLLVVSHHLNELATSCHSVTALRDGQTQQVLRGDDVTKSALVRLLLSGARVAEKAAQTVARPDAGEVLVRAVDAAAGRLRGMSFQARRGEIVGIAGRLGAGVDEVLDLLVGLRGTDSGEVTVGVEAQKPRSPHSALRAGAGFLTGDRSRAVVPGLTVRDHLYLPPIGLLTKLGFVRRRAERKVAGSLLNQQGIIGEPDAQMQSLSGGNQQRALLARWLAAEVDVLIVDRPTVGVDIAGRAGLLESLRTIASKRAIIISADSDELAAICDRVICLRKGVKVATLEGDDLTEDAIVDAIS
jgi:monosaccharide-transporting ATPase